VADRAGVPADVRGVRLHPGPTTGTVQQLLGRPALSFAQWAAENAAAFRAT